MYLTVRGPLRQHGPCAGVGSVDLQNKLDFRVRHDEDQGSGQARLEGSEGGVGFGCPAERDLGGRQCCQWPDSRAEPPDKPPIKIGEPEESLEFSPVGGGRPRHHCLCLRGVHGDPPSGHHKAEELDSGAVELALLCLGVEVVLQKPLEDEADVGDVFLRCLREDKDVVQVDEDIMVNDVTEDVINESLEELARKERSSIKTASPCIHSVPEAC